MGLLRPLSTSPGDVLYDASTFGGAFLNQPDVGLNAWILAWGSHALAMGRVRGFFDANIFHPAEQSLALSEHMAGALPLFAPLYLATERLAFAYNLWIVGSFLLCALSAYFVAFRLLGSRPAAAVAGVAYGFAPWRFAELAHVQVLSVQYLPLLVYVVWRTAERRDRWMWASIAGLAWIQAMNSFYLGYLAFITAGLAAAILSALQPGGRRARLVFVGTALAAAAVGMLPWTLPYLELEDGRILTKWFAEPDVLGQALAYLAPPLSDGARGPWLPWLGVPVFAGAGAVLGLRSPAHRPWVAALLAIGATGLLLANLGGVEVPGLGGHKLDDVWQRLVPGWAAVRVLSRLNLLAWLALSLLCALPFAVDPGRSPTGRRLRGGLAAAFALALVASVWNVELKARPAPESRGDVAAYRWLAEHGEGDPLLEWPMRFAQENSEYTYLSSVHWLPLVNGYSGYRPPWIPMLQAVSESFPEPKAVETLVSQDLVRWLLVHSGERWRRTLGWDRLAEQGAKLRLEGKGFALYELPYRGHPRPRLMPDPERSLLGTPVRPLRPRELMGTIRPARALAQRTATYAMPLAWDVRNESATRWPSVHPSTEGIVGLRLKVRDPESGDERVGNFIRLPADLAAGEATRIWTLSPHIVEPGDYRVIPCLAQDEALHCQERGALRLRVVPPPPPASSGHPPGGNAVPSPRQDL